MKKYIYYQLLSQTWQMARLGASLALQLVSNLLSRSHWVSNHFQTYPLINNCFKLFVKNLLCVSNVNKNWASAEDTRDTEGNIGGLEGVLMTAVWYHAFENAVMCVK